MVQLIVVEREANSQLQAFIYNFVSNKKNGVIQNCKCFIIVSFSQLVTGNHWGKQLNSMSKTKSVVQTHVQYTVHKN